MEAHTPIPSERTFGCEFEWCVGFRWEDVKPSNPDTGEITVISCLHPPERRFNYWSQSIRERSTLALGKVRPTTSENDLLHAVKARVKKQSIEGSSDTSPSDAPTYSTRRREGPRIPFPKYTAEEEARLKKIAEGGRFSILDPKARTDPGVFHGVKEILSYSAPCTISWLLEASVKPNYNFEGYSCLRVSNPSSRKRTVEFREAAGTTSGRWAETWARICVGIYEWAIHAPVAEYLAVLDNCDQAAKGGEYDVIDLLDQIGLSAESVIAEERVKNQTFWE
ncbi:hypothetical protein UCREL1_4520 [Eutypa lata UCREL1]|uniref:Uncharacterized protein n=1 Tax=Eutypa lata (strain UCR-EL1) TaxID=1287681 RepID=M7SPT6_EUTLA|nr:hypothetical protein UCREL1_4520 [Eutypa lata UCREL1]